MSIFDLFRRNVESNYIGPEITFGRYSDAFKDEVKQSLYESAIKEFEDEKPVQAITYLLDFLRNDLNDNVQYDLENNELFFEILQGSKRIVGRCNEEKFVAVSEVAKISKPNVGLYRRLLERNYLLRYCRFSLNDEMELSLKFDSFMQDASPKKIYNALHELSINADKYDDILIDEFDELSETNAGKIILQDDGIKAVKEAYIRKEINDLLKIIESKIGHSESYHNSISYLLLYCNYKLDYLTKPEGFIMEVLERNHRLFFTKNKSSAELKNEEIIKNFDLVLERSTDQIFEELYDTVHTFGYTKVSSHEQLQNLIGTELGKVSSYVNNKQTDIAIAIVGYTAVYGLFNFGFPQPDVDMLSLLLHILEDEYFDALGYSGSLVENGQPSQKAIEAKITAIQQGHEELYPEFKPNLSLLRYENKLIFGHSFLSMIRQYNLHYKGQIVL